MKLRYSGELILSIAVTAQILNIWLMSRFQHAGICEQDRREQQDLRHNMFWHVHLGEIPRRYLTCFIREDFLQNLFHHKRSALQFRGLIHGEHQQSRHHVPVQKACQGPYYVGAGVIGRRWKFAISTLVNFAIADRLLDQPQLGIDEIPQHKAECHKEQFEPACSERALAFKKHVLDVRTIFSSELESTDVGTEIRQPLQHTGPDPFHGSLADDVLGSPLPGFPVGVCVVAQRRINFVNERLNDMLATQPDGGLMHETRVDRHIQLKGLVDNVQLHNHHIAQSQDGRSEIAAQT